MNYNPLRHQKLSNIKKDLIDLLVSKGVKPKAGAFILKSSECVSYLSELFDDGLELDVIVSIKCDLVKCGILKSVRSIRVGGAFQYALPVT